MRRGLLVWPAVLALGALGVLLAHELAYRLAGSGGGAAAGGHGYLVHVPQVLLALTLPLLVLALPATRDRTPPPGAFALVGVAGFAAMEHAERLGAGVPWLLTSPLFLLGLALQLPFALAAWWVARTLLAAPPARRRRPPRLPRTVHSLAPLPRLLPLPAAPAATGPARAPPLLL